MKIKIEMRVVVITFQMNQHSHSIQLYKVIQKHEKIKGEITK